MDLILVEQVDPQVIVVDPWDGGSGMGSGEFGSGSSGSGVSSGEDKPVWLGEAWICLIWLCAARAGLSLGCT